MLLVWCHLLTGYELKLIQLFLHKMAPRPSLLVVQVYGEKVSSKIMSLNYCLCALFTPVSWLRADCKLERVLNI